MSDKVNVYINSKRYQAIKGEPLLNVARRNRVDIPALCYEESLKPYGACRLCLVDVKEGAKKGFTTSCTLACSEGLSVVTDTDEIKKHRKVLFELYLSQAPNSEKIKDMAARYGVFATRFELKHQENDKLNSKCVLCGLCVRTCNEIMAAGVINFIGRGHNTKINTPYFESSDVCLGCRACLEVCPTKAITIEDRSNIRIMASWSNTEVELKKCTVCGKYYAPERLDVKVDSLFYYKDKDEKLKDMCPECRKKYVAKKHTLIVEGEAEKYAK